MTTSVRPTDPPGRSWAGQALRVAAIVGAALLVAYTLWYARAAFLVVFAGILLAILLRGAARAIADRSPIPVRWALVLVVLLVLAAIAGLVAWRGPEVVAQFDTIRQQLPRAIEELRATIAQFEWGERLLRRAPSAAEAIPQMLPGGAPADAGVVARVTGVASLLLDLLVKFVIVVFLGIVLAAQPEPYVNGLVRLVPIRHRARAREVIGELGYTLRRWLVAQLISMLTIGALTYVGLRLLGVPLAFTLALIAGLLEFVPYVGPIASGVPAVLLAFLESPQLALWTALLYLGIQAVESYAIYPFLQWKAVWIPPALLILGYLLLGTFVGALGVALTAPITAAVLVLVQLLYVDDALGGDIPPPSERTGG